MKKIIIGLLILSLVLVTTSVTAKEPADVGLAASNGIDLFRGAWGGKMLIPEGKAIQVNLYFNESVLIDDVTSKASGYFSWDELDGLKRAKSPKLPMMANVTDLGDGTYELFILANVLIPSDEGKPITTVMKLTGKAKMGGSGVTDDIIKGEWYLKGPGGMLIEGLWSAVHLDRRSVRAPEVNLDDPTTDLYFWTDAYAALNGPATLPPEERGPCVILGIMSNIVMDSVRVGLPDGRSVIVPPYTDVFSPGVDWTTLFRFSTCEPGMPIAGGEYIFTALDVAGNPIPGVRNTDIWVGVEPPEPPTNVHASVTDEGILVTWDDVPAIPGSFEPAADPQLGFYQMAVDRVKPGEPGESVYGANHIAVSSHLIPQDKANFIEGKDWGLSLSEMEDGTYYLNTCVHSIAPESSLGKGFEYNNSDSGQAIIFTIEGGEITIQ